MKQYGIPSSGDWKDIIKAQVQTSKALQEEEKKHQKQTREFYKGILDDQLTYKQQTEVSHKEDLSKEREFMRAQVKAISDFERGQKEEDRKIQQILAQDYESENKRRVDLERSQREREKIQERRRMKAIEEQLQQEKQMEIARKNEIIRTQQQELQQNVLEKHTRKIQSFRERDRDREMIAQNMAKQAASEHSFREFYNQRQARQEEKLRAFHPVLRNEQAKWDAINRTNKEYQRQLEERLLKKEKDEEIRQKKNREVVKSELAKQLESQKEKRRLEFLEGIKEQNRARGDVEKLRMEKEIQIENRRKRMVELKSALDSQIKQKQHLSSSYMDPREKVYNKQLIEQIGHNKKVPFLGVPGVYSTEPRQLFHQKPQSLNFYSAHSSPLKEKMEFRREMDVFSHLKRENKPFIDPTKHDPIVNPIGAPLPKIIPGQRMHLKGSASFAL